MLLSFLGGLVATALGVPWLTPFLFIGGIALAVVAVLVATVMRSQVAASFYDLTADGRPSVGVGEAFTWGLTVHARRPLTVGDLRFTLRCQEHAISRGGTSDSHYRHTLFEHPVVVPGRLVSPGEAAEFRAQFATPANAIPSHRSANNFIEWTLEVHAPITGYCPDVHHRVDLWVQPQAPAASTSAQPGDEAVPAEWLAHAPVRGGQTHLEGVWVTVQAAEGAVLDQTPVLPAGTDRDFTLWVQTAEPVGCRGIYCWIGCRIHGAGTDEEVTLVPEQLIYEGALAPGQPVSYPFRLSLPPHGPVTFVGRYVKLEWAARVRLDIPLWFDKRLWAPIIVTPRRQ
jgi:hypothetical protein